MDATSPPAEFDLAGDAEPRAPRMLLVDVFVLTACTAAGLGLGRCLTREELRLDQADGAAMLLFGMLLPGLCGALVLGHPTLMLLHSLTGRRRGSILTFGEAAGLVPGVSLLLLFGILLLCWWIESNFDRFLAPSAFAACAGVLFVLANASASMAAAIYLATSLLERHRLTWTDLLGTLAALQPGGMLVILFLAALIAS